MILLTHCSYPVWADEVTTLLKNGEKALQSHQDEEAEKDFSEVLSLDSKNAQAHYLLGTVWMNKALKTKDKELLLRAVNEHKAAVTYNPLLGEAHDSMSYCYYVLGDYEKASYHYRKASALKVEDDFLKARLAPYLKTSKSNNGALSEKESQPEGVVPADTASPSDDELGGGLKG